MTRVEVVSIAPGCQQFTDNDGMVGFFAAYCVPGSPPPQPGGVSRWHTGGFGNVTASQCPIEQAGQHYRYDFCEYM